MTEACELYDKLLGNIDRLLALRAHAQFTHLAPLAPRVFAACQLLWPSKKFTEEEPSSGAPSVHSAMPSPQGAQRNREQAIPEGQ